VETASAALLPELEIVASSRSEMTDRCVPRAATRQMHLYFTQVEVTAIGTPHYLGSEI